MIRFLMTIVVIVLFCSSGFGQDTIAERLRKVEARLASMENSMSKIDAGQYEIKNALKEIKDAVAVKTTVSAKEEIKIGCEKPELSTSNPYAIAPSGYQWRMINGQLALVPVTTQAATGYYQPQVIGGKIYYQSPNDEGTCGPKGCSPQQGVYQTFQGDDGGQGGCSSSGGLFSRLRDRRAARRGW